MARLTSEAILAQTTMPEREVEIPEWGGSVLIRGLTKARADALNAQAQVPVMVEGKKTTVTDQEKLQLAMLTTCIVDPPFAPDQAGLFGGLANGPIQKLLMACLEINGLTVEGKTSQEAADTAQKSLPVEP